MKTVILIFFTITLLFFLIESTFTVCTFLDDDYLKSLEEIKEKHGVILNPRKMGALMRHYRWRTVDESWNELDTFFCGIPGVILQFVNKEDRREVKKKVVERYLKE